MPINYTDALDIMYGMINYAWPQVATLAGYTPLLYWPGQPEPQPNRDQIFARVSIQMIQDEQVSLGPLGQQKFEAHGLLYVQLFIPRTVAPLQDSPAFQALDPLNIGRLIAQTLQGIFRMGSQDGDIWFRRPTIRELASTPDYYPITLATEFMYQTVGTQVATVCVLTLDPPPNYTTVTTSFKVVVSGQDGIINPGGEVVIYRINSDVTTEIMTIIPSSQGYDGSNNALYVPGDLFYAVFVPGNSNVLGSTSAQVVYPPNP